MMWKSYSRNVALSLGLATACWAASPSAASGGTAAPSPETTLNTASAGSVSPETSALFEKADSHFNEGRQLYFQNNWNGAKREFDSAVNLLLDAPANSPDRHSIEHHLDEICDLVYRFDVEKMSSTDSADAAESFDKAPIDEVSHMTFPVDPAMAPKIESEVNQTPSGIPLELSEPVMSYVHFFSTDRGRAILLAGFKRAGRYRPLIQQIFAEEGIPQELIYLAQAESGFLPRAVSVKAAVGMWQFIADTGARYDLVRTSTFDERLDPAKATRAAAKYLKDLHTRYGDWYLAMAAYNCGEGAVDRAVERTGYADYWELLKRHALPRETSNYVPIIVAMTIMSKNAADYGLTNIESDLPVAYDSMQVSADTSLDLVADATMQPVSLIRDLNPSLLRSIVPAGFQVHVPSGTSQAAQTALETVPSANRNAWRLHHVESGDTLAAIARNYHTPVARIAEVNNRSTDTLATGDVLLIPAAFHPDVVKRPLRARSSRVVRSRSGLHSAHVSATRRVGHQATAHRPVHQVG